MRSYGRTEPVNPRREEHPVKLRSGFALPLFLPLLFAACSESTPPAPPAVPAVTDADLFSLQSAPSGWVFYRLRADTLARGGNSAHPDRVRTRYNAKAASQLDAEGRVRSGAAFPDSSLIVKDVFTGSTRTVIAYLYKLRAASNAGPGGWVWSETGDDGTPFIPASEKGSRCAPCHAPGIDYTRMNDVHP
jgi:hypothetical protein